MSIEKHISNVSVANHVVMPNHVHIILILNSPFVETRYIVSDVDGECDLRTPYMASLQEKSKQTVPKTIQQYKASVSRRTQIFNLWQPRFHDHIIRNEKEYQQIYQYIDENPIKWQEDCYYIKG